MASSASPSDSASNFVADVRKKFSVSDETLTKLITHFHGDMEKGLKGETSTLKMIPSFVGMPNGNETGVFYALDLGGTNFRVLRIKLEGKGVIGKTEIEQYKIPDSAMTGPGEELFDFIATRVKEFADKYDSEKSSIHLGFTFSFPVKQTGIASGSLINWTKGFTASNVEGHDVVELLQKAFQRKGVPGNVAALANDTVGTMIAKAYSEQRTVMGVILGTGTNACYLEHTSAVAKKLTSDYKAPQMIINMEWGAFGDGSNSYLPLTAYDVEVDKLSPNAHKQLFEKMISGMYLGELLRQMLLDYVKHGGLTGKATSQLQTYKVMDASAVSIALGADKSLIKSEVLVKSLGYSADALKSDDVHVVEQLAHLISERSARLSAMGVAGVAQWISQHKIADSKNGLVVAVDGGVFEKTPGYADILKTSLKSLLNSSTPIELVLSKDGSGLGAAIIASTVSK